MDSEDDTSPPEERLPSNRPIDRRWDRSRGIIFNNAKRNRSGNFTWSPSDGIVFADGSTFVRRYAVRNLFAPQRIDQAPPTKPRSERNTVSDPHRLSSSDIGAGGVNLYQRVRQEQAAHENTKKQNEEQRRQMQRGYEKEQEKVLAERAALYDSQQDELNKQIADLQNQVEKFDKRLREQTRQSSERYHELELRQLDLAAREKGLADTISKAKQDAEAKARQNFKDQVAAADKRDKTSRDMNQAAHRIETEAAAKAEEHEKEYARSLNQLAHNGKEILRRMEKEAKVYETHYDESLERLKRESEQELRERKETQDKIAAERVVSEINELRKEPIRRHDVERKDYDAYHAVWDQIGDENRAFSNGVFQLYRRLAQISEMWQFDARSFDRWREAPRMSDRWKNSQQNSYSPPSFDTSFSQAYPELSKALRVFMSSKAEQALQTVTDLDRLRRSAREAKDDLDREAHFSRTLTRHHQFEVDSSRYLETSLVESLLNDRPLRDLGATLARQMKASKPDSAEQSMLKKKHSQISKLRRYFNRVREVKELEAIRNDSIHQKAVWFVTHNARESQEDAWRKWSDYTKDNPVTSESGGINKEREDSNREQFREIYGTAREERDNVTNLIRSRVLMEDHLGEIEDETVYDSKIDGELEQAKLKQDEALEDILDSGSSSVGSGAFVRRPASSRIAAAKPALPVSPSKSGSTWKEQVDEHHSLKKELETPDAYASAEEKQEDERKMLQLKISIRTQEIERATTREAKLLEKSPANHAAALDVQRGIDSAKRALAKTEHRLKAMDGEEESVVDSKDDSTKAAQTAPAEPETQNTRRSRLRIRQQMSDRDPRRLISGISGASGLMEPGKDVSGLSKADSEEISSGFVNFKPTTGQQAPKPYWPADPSSSGAGGLNKSSVSLTSASSPTSGASNRSFDHTTNLSQAIRQLSLESARAIDGQHMHIDTNINKTFGFFSPNDSRSNFQLISNDSNEQSQPTIGFDLDSSSSRSFDGPSDLDSSSEHSTAMHSEDSTHDTSEARLIENTEAVVELTYQIPPEDFRNAVLASQKTNAAFWNAKLYKNANGKAPLVLYCTSYDTAEICAKKFLNESVIGFDIEWEAWATIAKSTPKQNVSLIQIAAEDKIGLFHIALFNGDTVDKLMPPSLRAILESNNFAKAGVNIANDATRLRKCLNVDMQGLFELSHLYRVVELSRSDPAKVNKRLVRLAEQVQNVLGLPLKKDDVQTSSWSKKLSLEQTEYAASDAYAGFRLYHALESRRKKMAPMPPRPAFWEEQKPLQFGNGRAIVSKPYTAKRKRMAVDDVEDGGQVDNDDECEEFFDTVEEISDD